MCNRQPISYAPQQAAALRNTRALAPVPTAGRTAATQQRATNPMIDIHTQNPKCEYEQLTPDGVPICVTPQPDEPISVQPNGPGTPFVDSLDQNGISTLPAPMPESMTNYNFVPGFLRAHVGDLVRVEFLVTDSTTDRVGVLSEVGASYIVLESLDGSSRLMCDLFSIRFVTIMQGSTNDVLSTDTIYASTRFQG